MFDLTAIFGVGTDFSLGWTGHRHQGLAVLLPSPGVCSLGGFPTSVIRSYLVHLTLWCIGGGMEKAYAWTSFRTENWTPWPLELQSDPYFLRNKPH